MLAEHAFEFAGVAILLVGGLISTAVYVRDVLAGRSTDRPTRRFATTWDGRSFSGSRSLIIADIILTVAIDQTLESAATLGLIVLVRTFLSFSLDIEMDGVRRGVVGGRTGARPDGGHDRLRTPTAKGLDCRVPRSGATAPARRMR